MNWKTWVILAAVILAAGLIGAWQMTPRVLAVEPAGEELHGRQALTVQFSRPMNPTSVKEHLSLTPELAASLSWNQAADQLTYLPENSWPSGQTLFLEISAGARSRGGLPLLVDYQAELDVRPYLLAYLWPAEGPSNLFLANPETGESRALTDLESGILDFSLGRDGSTIIFAYPREQGGTVIASLDTSSGDAAIILDCAPALCRSPRMSPTSNLLAYEYLARGEGAKAGIRVYSLEDQSTLNPGSESDSLENPLWSSTGWLAYYNQTRKGFEFWDPATGQTKFLANDTAGNGSWSADGRYFISSQIQYNTGTLAPRHLLLFDLEDETTLDLTRGNFLEDLNPSLAPFGLITAYSRKALDPQNWTPGRQLWILDIETGRDRQLTDEPDFHHGSFAWHPGGEKLVYVRYNQSALSDPPEIWLINADGSENMRLIINGFAPAWIP